MSVVQCVNGRLGRPQEIQNIALLDIRPVEIPGHLGNALTSHH